MARLSPVATALLVGMAILSPRALAQPQPLPRRIAIYAPWAGPSTADERHALALAIERGLAKSGSISATVASYAKLTDFRRAMTSGNVDIALVDSAAATALGKRLGILASWSSGESWLLAGLANSRSRPRQRLALQAADAGSSTTVVARLLRGQAARDYWSAIVGAPVTADARELVLRGKADVVLLPRRLAGGLTELVDLGKFTELVLASTGRRPIADATRRIVESVVRANLGGSWSKGPPRFPDRVAPTRLVVAPPQAAAPSLLDLFAPLAPRLPVLAVDTMWMAPSAR